MRPRMKKCKAAVKRRDVATQTSVLDVWSPRVVLNRVEYHQEKSPPRQEQEVVPGDKSEIGEIVTVHDKPVRLSKLPSSYRLFVKPITNNDKANSTLLIDAEEEMLVHNLAFVKPGPMCYKKRISEKLSRSMTVPRVRQEPEEVEDRNGLEPLLENPLETASTPDMLELNLNVSSIGSIVEYNERSTQTQTAAGTTQESDRGGTEGGTSPQGKTTGEPPPAQNDEDPPPGPSGIDAKPIGEPNGGASGEPVDETRAANTSYRMKMNGVATTITTVPEGGTTPDSSSDETESDENTTRQSRRTKFLKIRAHTVHIHNHFYGSRK
ncbi:unnamed protein product [Callosobruchus maculatus]|uniref:Uncharacterized protein n=1 Tax=Callosobruchus maculatus TaxID=64391 RepID=A0A653BHF8_CALMS|nr:unnamed protein product [Callosobruchus maculatus]